MPMVAFLQLSARPFRPQFQSKSISTLSSTRLATIRCSAATSPKRYSITLLPGDGIGPEVISVAKNVLKLAGSLQGIEFGFQEMPVGGCALDLTGVPLPEETLLAAKQSDAVLLGAIGGYKWDNNEKHLKPETGLLQLRSGLKVFANLRPASVLPQIHTKKGNRLEHQRLNALVYVRYNTRLRERSLQRKQNVDPILIEEIDSDDEWIAEKEDPLLPLDLCWLQDDELFNVDAIRVVSSNSQQTQASSDHMISSHSYKSKHNEVPSADPYPFKMATASDMMLVSCVLVDASTLKKEVAEGVDLMVVRELTGGIYFGKPRGFSKNENGEEIGFNTEVYTTYEIDRIARIAFEIARKRRGKLCSVDKANVLEASMLWRKRVTAIAREYPDIELSHMYVDNAAMQLVLNPKQFDTIVTNNIFGDILSDEASMITGSIGMLPSASLGESGPGLFEPIHGSAPDIAGEDKANPLATILSAAMLLRYGLGEANAATRIETAVMVTLDRGFRTGDIYASGTKLVGCKEMGDEVLKAVESQLPAAL